MPYTTTTTSKLSHYIHKFGIQSNHRCLVTDPSILASDPESAECSISNAPPTTMLIVSLATTKPWSAQLQISTHLNLFSDYRGVKAKNEGVFDWLIKKKTNKHLECRVNISNTLRARSIQRGMECYV
jgi:hypothetical protein